MKASSHAADEGTGVRSELADSGSSCSYDESKVRVPKFERGCAGGMDPTERGRSGDLKQGFDSVTEGRRFSENSLPTGLTSGAQRFQRARGARTGYQNMERRVEIRCSD